MEDVLDQGIKNKVLRFIDFCEGEGIEDFMFRDMETFNDCYVEFSFEYNFDEYWQLKVSFKYVNTWGDSEYTKEDEDYFYKIENEIFTRVENFDYNEDEDYYDDEDESDD